MTNNFYKYKTFRSEVTWSEEDEQRLRRHISKLKVERSMVRSTTVELESVHAEPLNSKNTISLAEARKLDLETAVLMQVRINLSTLEKSTVYISKILRDFKRFQRLQDIS